jgi:hypothetical protein
MEISRYALSIMDLKGWESGYHTKRFYERASVCGGAIYSGRDVFFRCDYRVEIYII